MSALSGHKAWVAQRVTALYLAIYLLTALGYFALVGAPTNSVVWRALFSDAVISMFTLGFFGALTWHAWIGIRDVIVDYVRPVWLRFAMLSFFGIGLLLCMLWVGRVLFNAMAL